MNGKTYTIEEAIKEMPIPNKNCTFCGYGLKNFCKCMYTSIIEWESL